MECGSDKDKSENGGSEARMRQRVDKVKVFLTGLARSLRMAPSQQMHSALLPSAL
jgi:hypothetical protein